MTQSDSNKPPSDEDSTRKAERAFDRHFNSLFHTIVGLPSAIYNRGTEHGREWNRKYQDGKESQDEAPKERELRSCPRRDRPEIKPSKDVHDAPNDIDDWVSRVIKELERGEEQAKEMYEWWRKMEEDDMKQARREMVQRDIEETRHGSHDNQQAEYTWNKQWNKEWSSQHNWSWSEIFPAWSTRGAQREEATDSQSHVFTKEDHDNPRPSPIKDVEETVDKLHQDLERWLGDAEQWRQRFQQGYERDSRLWQDEGLFGPSFPLSRPLSTFFSLGMRPFMPQDSAIGYLLYSEYSPLHLEHETGFDSSFRQRFEDLIRIQDGKTMLSNEEVAEGKASSGVEWLGRVVPLLKDGENGRQGQITIGNTSDRQPVVQIEEVREGGTDHLRGSEEHTGGPDTEQDLYERHFGDLPRTGVERPVPFRPVHRATEAQASRPDVLSTLTTTERHVARDGSVTTKTVLKKRFADGREESSETVETKPATAMGLSWPERQSGIQERQTSSTQGVDQRKKGWFWSTD